MENLIVTRDIKRAKKEEDEKWNKKNKWKEQKAKIKKQHKAYLLYLDNFSKKSNLPSFLRTRFRIFARDNFQCQYCGRSPRKDRCKLEIDHIIPRNNNGSDEESNLITSCKECNLGKAYEKPLGKEIIIKLLNKM